MPKVPYKSYPGDQNRNANDAEVATQLSTTATAGGGVAIPATVKGFIVFELADGSVAKVPYYNA